MSGCWLLSGVIPDVPAIRHAARLAAARYLRVVATARLARVVVGTSGSPGSLAALRYAEFLARSHDAVLVPVLAWEPPGGDRAAQVQPVAGLAQAWRELACERMRDALAQVWGEPVT